MNFGQTIWDKTQVLLGTSWGTHLETMREQENKTNNPIPPLPAANRKKLDRSWCMLSLPIGCMKFPFPELFVAIFGLG
jgi:hypothetical protein